MRDEVDGLAQTEVDTERVAQAGLFDRLAGNLGALGFLIDMLSVQPQLAKSLFAFDAEDRHASDPLMGRGGERAARHGATPARAAVEPRLIEQAQQLAFSALREDVPVAEVARDLERLSIEAHGGRPGGARRNGRAAREALVKADEADDRAGVASVRGDLSEALVDFVATRSEPAALDPIRARCARAALRGAAPAAWPRSAELAEDDEMREIFLEEAREVLARCRRGAGQRWPQAPSTCRC